MDSTLSQILNLLYETLKEKAELEEAVRIHMQDCPMAPKPPSDSPHVTES